MARTLLFLLLPFSPKCKKRCSDFNVTSILNINRKRRKVNLVGDVHLFKILREEDSKVQLSALVYLVRIPDSHSGGPGSIPGRGIFVFYLNKKYSFNVKFYVF